MEIYFINLFLVDQYTDKLREEARCNLYENINTLFRMDVTYQ